MIPRVKGSFESSMMSLRLCLCVGWCLSLWSTNAWSQDATRWLPDGLNAVLVIDAVAAYRSPIAQENQWAKRATEAFVAQEVFLPPSARRVTIGAQLDWGRALEPVRQHVVLEVKVGTDFQDVALLMGGEVEKAGDVRGLAFAGGRYIVEAKPLQWLMVQPGGRQAGLRWVRSGMNDKSRLSPLLQKAADSVSEQYQIVAALDLTDAVEFADAKSIVADLPGQPIKGPAVDKTAELLTTVQGVVCKVHLGTLRTLQCRIEFGKSAAPLASVAQPLVETVLDRWGASLEDATKLRTRADGTALVLEGELSMLGLKRLISIIRPPVVSGAAPETSTPAPTDPAQAAVISASKKYLRSVQHELDDLRATLKRTRDNHALWYERAGRTIDDLPMNHVDGDLLTFGSRVSSSLRYQSQAERMANVRTGTRMAQSQANTFYSGVGSYGEIYRRVSPANAPAIAAEENQNAAGVKFSEWKQIEDGLVEVRRTLTQRYGTDF